MTGNAENATSIRTAILFKLWKQNLENIENLSIALFK